MNICPNCNKNNLQRAKRCEHCQALIVKEEPVPIHYFFLATFLLIAFLLFLSGISEDSSDLTGYAAGATIFGTIGLILFAGIRCFYYNERKEAYLAYLSFLSKKAMEEKKEYQVQTEEERLAAERRAKFPELRYFDELAVLDRALDGDSVAAQKFESGELAAHSAVLRRALCFPACVPSQTVKNVTEGLKRYSESCGWTFSEELIHELLVSMSMSRIIFLDTESDLDAERFVSILSGYFGCCAHATRIDPAWRNKDELYGMTVRTSEETGGTTGIFLDLYCAKAYPERVSLTLLENTDFLHMKY